jgi:hypothetical protein
MSMVLINGIRNGSVIAALFAITACSTSGTGADASKSAFVSLTSPTLVTDSSSGAGGTRRETLTGAAINGVVPEGQALADLSRFASGGDTFLTVTIRKVNLPDGTNLGVNLDFKPLGSITLSGGSGTLTVNLGHFAPSRDPVTVKQNGATILGGGFFQ